MKKNFAQELGFILNAITIITVIVFVLFLPIEMELFYKLILSIGILLSGLVTGTILLTLGKILETLEKQSNE